MSDSPSLDQVRAMFRDHGARRLLVKFLSPNDNSKNQIYLGGDLGVVNIVPAGEPLASTSGSHAEPIFKAPLRLSWLDVAGGVHSAPHAQLILYPQYPEVRLSGFLRGCPAAPSQVLTARDEGRLLLLGIKDDRSVIGYASMAETPLATEVSSLPLTEELGVFKLVPLVVGSVGDSRPRLLRELCRIHRAGWIEGWRLRADGARAVCTAPNCVGVTLESELGIVPNSRAEPDFEGWEIKGLTVARLDRPSSSPITLMTPEPTGGLYAESGVLAFVHRFGYPDTHGRSDRLNFGGIHRVGAMHPRTKLMLALEGYDFETQTITRSDGALALVDTNGTVAASWPFASLLAHWQKKHSRTAFVPALVRHAPSRRYHYGANVILSRGTDYLRLLDGLASGVIYYDPGIKLENASTAPAVKRRSQFRIKANALDSLYHTTQVVAACGN